MKVLQKSLLVASLFTVGASAATLSAVVNQNTVHAEVNQPLNYATVTVTAPTAQLYAQDGTPLSRTLSKGSVWKTDSQASTAIGNLYRVATNEYVRASDVYMFVNTPGIAENNGEGMGEILLRNYNVRITSAQAPLYDMNGNRLSRALNQGTLWKVGTQSNINTGTYYSVASGEYVKASDVYLYSAVQSAPNQTIQITTNYSAAVSNQYGQIIPGRFLPAYTYWKTDRYTTINGIGYYRVGINEYINEYYVR